MSDRQPKMPPLDELILSAQHRKAGGQACWVVGLPAEPAEYMERLMAVEVLNPGRVNRKQVKRDLLEYFDISVGDSAVKRHFAKECKCE